MKTIKYRTWSVTHKKFFYWGLNIDGPSGAWFIGPIDEPNAPQEQFTGLLDRDGKEVYVGDIVLQWDRKRTIQSLEQAFYMMQECTLDCTCKITGNIHEGMK